MRFDMYSLIHKAQREHLFTLAIKIGKANLDDAVQVDSIKTDLKKMINHLRKHAANEERFIHPFFYVCKDKSALLESQHKQIEVLLDELEASTKESSLEELYPLFNRLIASYLQHIDLEESIQKEILWEHFSDEDLKGAMNQYQQSLTPEENLEGLEFMLPCLRVSEVKNLMAGMRKTAPENLVKKVSLIIERVLTH